MSGANRWPAIRALLAWRNRVTLAGAIAVAMLGFWLAWRTGWPELAVFGLLVAVVTHAVLRIAIEVVSLVAETLMPQ